MRQSLRHLLDIILQQWRLKKGQERRTVSNKLRKVPAMGTFHTRGNQQENQDESTGVSSAPGQGQPHLSKPKPTGFLEKRGLVLFLPLKMLACQQVVFLQLSKDKQWPSEISSKNLGETKLLSTARLREAGTLSCPLPVSQCSTYRWLSGTFSQSEHGGQEFQVYRRFLEHLPWLCDLPQSSFTVFLFSRSGDDSPKQSRKRCQSLGLGVANFFTSYKGK